MPQFSYTARTAQGMITSGTIDAISIQAARDALKETRLEPEEIHETTMSEREQFEQSSPPEELLFPTTDSPFTGLPGSLAPSSPVASPGMETRSENKETGLKTEQIYFPLIDTLRLYAGWLLAWYFLVYSLGSYQHFRHLPFEIPFLEGLFLSPLVLSFTLASFLFLLLTGMWKFSGSGWKAALLLFAFGIACFLAYRENVA